MYGRTVEGKSPFVFGGYFFCFVRDFKVLFIVNVCFIKSLNLGGNGGKIRLFSIRKYRIYHGRRY